MKTDVDYELAILYPKKMDKPWKRSINQQHLLKWLDVIIGLYGLFRPKQPIFE